MTLQFINNRELKCVERQDRLSTTWKKMALKKSSNQSFGSLERNNHKRFLSIPTIQTSSYSLKLLFVRMSGDIQHAPQCPLFHIYFQNWLFIAHQISVFRINYQQCFISFTQGKAIEVEKMQRFIQKVKRKTETRE